MIRLELWVLRRKTEEVKSILITSEHEYILIILLTPVDVQLGHLADIVIVRFLHCTVVFCFHAVLFRRKSLYAVHI